MKECSTKFAVYLTVSSDQGYLWTSVLLAMGHGGKGTKNLESMVGGEYDNISTHVHVSLGPTKYAENRL